MRSFCPRTAGLFMSRMVAAKVHAHEAFVRSQPALPVSSKAAQTRGSCYWARASMWASEAQRFAPVMSQWIAAGIFAKMAGLRTRAC